LETKERKCLKDNAEQSKITLSESEHNFINILHCLWNLLKVLLVVC